MNAAPAPAVEIEHATVRLSGEQVLTDFSCRIERGERCFILGPNGAGKTTLVKLILGLVWPLFGAKVSVLGNRYGFCNIIELRKKIAWASPFLNTWAGDPSSRRWTALEITLSGLESSVGFFRTATEEELEKAHRVLALLDADRISGRFFDLLSSGEQVKVLIARALIGKPELLILDETCVYLDLTSRETLLGAIDRLARSPEAPTMLFVTQRIEEITETFRKGMILRDGRMLYQGSREEVLTPEHLSETFSLPVRLDRTPDGRLWPVLTGKA